MNWVKKNNKKKKRFSGKQRKQNTYSLHINHLKYEEKLSDLSL